MTPPHANPSESPSIRTVRPSRIGEVQVSFQDLGRGRPYLVLHGGAGPMSVEGFARTLSGRDGTRVILPTHPGFGGTPRPERLNTVRGLAEVYVALLDELDLHDVTLFGNSIGGWLAAEIALLASPRVHGLVLVDAGGIDVAGHPAAEVSTLTPDRLSALAYHDPARFRIDPTQQTEAQRTAMAANRSAMTVYAGRGKGSDPTLRERLRSITVPTLVLWGESDGIYDPEYGRAYAEAIPGSTFRLVPAAGHLPQLEAPQEVLRLLLAFPAIANLG